jgi:hypothetical protein
MSCASAPTQHYIRSQRLIADRSVRHLLDGLRQVLLASSGDAVSSRKVTVSIGLPDF